MGGTDGRTAAVGGKREAEWIRGDQMGRGKFPRGPLFYSSDMSDPSCQVRKAILGYRLQYGFIF